MEVADETSGALLIIRKAGFVITGKRWGEKDRVPEIGTLPIEPAVAIGGRVVDPQGHPVSHAQVHLIISNGPLTEIEAGPRIHDEEVKTDANGEWRFTQSPASPRHISIRFSHPDFLSDTHYRNQEGNFADFFQFTHSRTLCKGLPLVGTVHDEAGRPVAGAAVRQGRDRWGTHYPETVTTEEGRFEFGDVGTETIILTVQAQGYAPEVREVSAGSGLVEFILHPPSIIKARVIDTTGAPLVGVTVFADMWRRYRAIEWRTETDQEGRFAWTDAPSEEVQFDLHHKGFMSVHRFPLIPGPEQEIVLIKAMRLSLSVVDAQSGEKLPSFEFQVEFTIPNCDPPRWTHGPSLHGSDGRAEANPTIRADRRRIKVTAPGYYPSVSEEFSDDYPLESIEIRMQKGDPLSGRVIASQCMGAFRAEVVVVSEQSIFVTNGTLPRHSRNPNTVTDAEGFFTLPPRREASPALIIHPAGYLELSTNDLRGHVYLESWASVKGTVIRQGVAAAGETVSLYRPHEGGPGDRSPRVYYRAETITDAKGRFFIERFPPGSCRIARKIEDRRGGIADQQEIELHAGQTLEVTLGGKGIAVTLRVEIPEGMNVDFPSCNGSLAMPLIIDGPSNLTYDQRQAWVAQWQQSAGGQATMASLRRYPLAISGDGTVTMENVVPGDYMLQIILKNKAGHPLGMVRKQVVISSEMKESLDLGIIRGEPLRRG